MTTKELIRAEIERLKSKYRHNGLWTSSFQSDLAMAKIESMNELLSFLGTMPDEPVTDCHELTEEIERTYHDGSVADTDDMDHVDYENIARHFAEWGANHLRDTTGKVPEDLEEAAENSWVDYEYREDPRGLYSSCYIGGFKEGAEWRKRKMMEGAEECELYWDGDFLAIDLNMRELGYSERDKVSIIILPKEEEQ